jgi:hypothetical protein
MVIRKEALYASKDTIFAGLPQRSCQRKTRSRTEAFRDDMFPCTSPRQSSGRGLKRGPDRKHIGTTCSRSHTLRGNVITEVRSSSLPRRTVGASNGQEQTPDRRNMKQTPVSLSGVEDCTLHGYLRAPFDTSLRSVQASLRVTPFPADATARPLPIRFLCRLQQQVLKIEAEISGG